MAERGTFIVLEGGEGAGKTSVANYLKAQLPSRAFLFTREPGGTPLAEKIRQVMISEEAAQASAETQLGLIFGARFDHVNTVIRPALEKGTHVISERFDSAAYGYQIFGQEAPHLKPLFFEWRKLLGDCLPTLYILLDVNPAEGLKRMRQNRVKEEVIDQFEKRSVDFHERVRSGLHEFLQRQPHRVINANRPFAEVASEALALIQKAV